MAAQAQVAGTDLALHLARAPEPGGRSIGHDVRVADSVSFGWLDALDGPGAGDRGASPRGAVERAGDDE